MSRLYRVAFIGIAIAILVGLMTVFIQRSVRNAYDKAQCRNNIMLIGVALCDYASNGFYPPATIQNNDLTADQRLSWIAQLGIGSFFSANTMLEVDITKPWTSNVNRHPWFRHDGREGWPQSRSPGRVLSLCHCPGDPDVGSSDSPSPTSYIGISGLGLDAATLPLHSPRAGMFGFDRLVRQEDVKDGLSSTMAVAETSLRTGPWTAGGFSTTRGLDPSRQPYIGKGRQFGGLHHGGAFVSMADGSARFLSERINPQVFEALSTIAGGETPISDANISN